MTPNGVKKLDSVSFDTFMREKQPLADDRALFDLREFDLVTPAALVQLATACYAMAGNGQRPRIMIENAAVRGYLQRCGFVDVVSGVAGIEPAIRLIRLGRYNSVYGSNPMLIEVTRIARGADLPDLLDRIVWVLHFRLKYRKHDAYDVTTAVSEICQNTFDHNLGTAGFIAMQVYGKGSNRFLEIGVSDYGDGLATTLRRNPKNGAITSDLDAIKMATRLGTSEYDDRTRGTGLYHLLEITYKHAGSIQIKSGAAKVRYRMDKREGWTFAVPSVPGVHVALTLPTKDRS